MGKKYFESSINYTVQMYFTSKKYLCVTNVLQCFTYQTK